MQPPFSYLALGDSYTIGELVPLHQSFPYQAVQLLRKKGFDFPAPEIIAKTGWTTDELTAAIMRYRFRPQYSFASLLIGVNNQYRGRDAIAYKLEFEALLTKAIKLTGKPSHVIVLSIPDYSVTPFAASMHQEKISREIDVFNAINKAVSIQYKAQYIDITAGTRKAKTNPLLLATDQLHPSEKEYRNWAKKLAAAIVKQVG
jgi:lysophospholipase L1-like esterase